MLLAEAQFMKLLDISSSGVAIDVKPLRHALGILSKCRIFLLDITQSRHGLLSLGNTVGNNLITSGDDHAVICD